ncbi:MAG TPA: DUF721 domain-containing protein [Xenococcaceae cyanobacterium]
MFSNSLKNILQQITQQPGWEQYQQYCEVKGCWQKIINQKIAQNTCPISISRQVLWVATSSAVWAQELSLQRYNLLKKLNAQLTFTLTDIRFSTTNWHKLPNNIVSPQEDVNKNAEISNAASKIAIDEVRGSPVVSRRGLSDPDRDLELPQTKASLDFDTIANDETKINDPKLALQKWLEQLKARIESPVESYFSCPQCGSPTPAIELERWQMCCHCIAHKWSLEYRPPTQTQENN